MRDPVEIRVAHTDHEVLLWQPMDAVSQRVVRLYASAPALLGRLADDGAKPSTLRAVWLERAGFETMLAQALGDPDGVVNKADRALAAQHRLATRFAQVRVAFEADRDAQGDATGHTAPCFTLRNAARHQLKQWTTRTAEVDARGWHRGEVPKEWRSRPFRVDPAVWCPWARS